MLLVPVLFGAVATVGGFAALPEWQPPAGSLPAATAVLQPLAVGEAVRLAIQNSPRLVAVSRDVAAARQGTRAAGALANPQVIYTPALTGGIGGGSDTELLVQQPLEINGTRVARRGGARAREQGTVANAVVELRAVVFDARSAYYELARARGQAALARDLLKTAEELNRLAQTQVELGARPAVEQTQTGIEGTRARQQVTLADAEVVGREAALNASLGRPADSPIGVVALSPTLTDTALPDAPTAMRQALAQRAEINAGIAAAEAQRQDARLARAEGIPDLAPQFRATSVTQGSQGGGFGVGVTLPFLDYGSRRGRVRQAEEVARAEEGRVAAIRLQIQQEVVRAIAQTRGAQAVLLAYTQGNLLADAERLLAASRLGYQEGKTSIVQLIEAQRTYRQVQNDYLNAQANLAVALAELERATGAVPAALLHNSQANGAPAAPLSPTRSNP